MTDDFFQVGRESLARDLNLVRIIRRLRVIDNFIEDKMTKNELKEAKQLALR